MQQINVKLLNYSQEPELTVAKSARLCYFKDSIEDLQAEIESKDIKKYLTMLLKKGHLSPFEHISFTFGAEGISRNCSHQLVRHRVASYSQQSQRYVDLEDTFSYIIPPGIEKYEDMKMQFQNHMGNYHDFYNQLVTKGIKPEDARFVLPSASETKIIFTMNARELFLFFSLRLCKRAQWEIRAMAEIMVKQVKEIAPIVFSKVGPTCKTQCICKDNNKTCPNFKAFIKKGSKLK